MNGPIVNEKFGEHINNPIVNENEEFTEEANNSIVKRVKQVGIRGFKSCVVFKDNKYHGFINNSSCEDEYAAFIELLLLKTTKDKNKYAAFKKTPLRDNINIELKSETIKEHNSVLREYGITIDEEHNFMNIDVYGRDISFTECNDVMMLKNEGVTFIGQLKEPRKYNLSEYLGLNRKIKECEHNGENVELSVCEEYFKIINEKVDNNKLFRLNRTSDPNSTDFNAYDVWEGTKKYNIESNALKSELKVVETDVNSTVINTYTAWA